MQYFSCSKFKSLIEKQGTYINDKFWSITNNSISCLLHVIMTKKRHIINFLDIQCILQYLVSVFMVLNATFNNISVISWGSVLLVGETGENHGPVESRWQTLSHNVVSSTPRREQGSNPQLQWWFRLITEVVISVFKTTNVITRSLVSLHSHHAERIRWIGNLEISYRKRKYHL